MPRLTGVGSNSSQAIAEAEARINLENKIRSRRAERVGSISYSRSQQRRGTWVVKASAEVKYK